MNVRDGTRLGADAVDEPVAVLLVAGTEAMRAALETAISERMPTNEQGPGGERIPASVTSVPDADAAQDQLDTVDCIVCADPDPVTPTCACVDVLQEEATDVPLILYAPITDVGVVGDALAAGVTDVVPRETENALSVLADRVLRAAKAARAMERASEHAATLKGERDRFAALFENIPEPTVFYEMDGDDPVTIDVNPAFESVFGYEAETVRGSVVDDFIVPEDKVEEAAELNDRIADGEHLDTEVRRLTADGQRDFLLRDVPLQEDDTMRGYAIYTDITPQREREERLRETTTQLEAQNERLEAFTGVVSHDLRNPLSVAMTYTDLLQDRYDDEDLAAVDRALDRMDDLIQDLLALAQQGTDARDKRLLDLETVARDAWRAVETHGSTLTVTVEDAGIRADESRLRQLFENLFANSIEHGSTASARGATTATSNPVSEQADADDDSSSLGVDGAPDSDGNGTDDNERDGVDVTVGIIDEAARRGFYVADDGPGIPEDEREQVFDQGYTGGNGTGFGLAIVKAVAEAHDWSVSVTESADGGARFDVTNVDLNR